jgi:hypothetical protein
LESGEEAQKAVRTHEKKNRHNGCGYGGECHDDGSDHRRDEVHRLGAPRALVLSGVDAAVSTMGLVMERALVARAVTSAGVVV